MPSLILESAIVTLTALLVHGLVDDPLYSSWGILLLLVPFGLLAALDHTASEEKCDKPSGTAGTSVQRIAWPICLTLALTVAMIGYIVNTSGAHSPEIRVPFALRWRATWYANLGVVAQTQIELNGYDPYRFAEQSIDDVRRQVNLAPASRHLSRATGIDPGNATACRRQAMIALAHFDYDQAYALMQAAWNAGHRDRVTKLLYGDALVAVGRVDEAVEVVQGIPFARDRLDGQAWDRYKKHGDIERAEYAHQAAQAVQ